MWSIGGTLTQQMLERTPGAKKKRFRLLHLLLGFLTLYIAPVSYQLAAHHFDWEPAIAWASSNSRGEQLAEDPTTTNDAIIQVYAARAARWRGALGVHSWIAVKRSNEDFYTRIEVIGYALRWGNQTVQLRRGQPDRNWYGNPPELLRELRGAAKVDQLIDQIFSMAANYQYLDEYNVWPGPNSNTFIAHLARQIPELSVDLPPTALGKDFLPGKKFFGKPASGKGIQLSVNGLFSLVISQEEGFELNLFGATAGLDLSPPAIKLPAIGRVGMQDSKRITLQ